MSSKKAFPLRMRVDVYDALRVWADDELRSVNAQIEFLLTDALKRRGRLPRSGPKGNRGGSKKS